MSFYCDIDPGWLPEETISYIISYLSLNDYRNLTIVSQQWAKASKAKSNWDKIEFKGSMANALKFATGLRLHHSFDVIELRFIITCDPKAKPLASSFSYDFPQSMTQFGTYKDQQNSFSLGLLFPRLERFSLQFDNQIFKNLAQLFNEINERNVSGDGAYNLQRGYKELLSNLSLPKLEFIDISILQERSFDAFSVSSFLANFPLLKHVIIRGESVSEPLFDELSRAPNLTTLDLGLVNISPTRNQVLQEWSEKNNVLVICNVGGQQLGAYPNCIWQSFRDMSLAEELSPWASILAKHKDFGHWLLYGMIWSGQKSNFIKYLFDTISLKYVLIFLYFFD